MDDIVDINTLFGPLPVASTDLNVDSLSELLQKYRIRAACTLSTLGLLLDPSVGNAATRAACAEHPELIPVATLNPTMFFGDVAPIRQLQPDGFCVARFFPTIQGWPVGFVPFRNMLQPLAESKLPIMIDVDSPGQITTLTGVLNGYPAAVILAEVSVSLLAETTAALRQFPNWFVETSRLLAPGAIKLIADTAGPERVLFGTGAPSRPIASVLNTMQYAGLSEEARQQVLSGNAKRILGI